MIDYLLYAPALESIAKSTDLWDRLSGTPHEALKLESLGSTPIKNSTFQILIDHLLEITSDDFFLTFRQHNDSAPRHFSIWLSDNCETVEESLMSLCHYTPLTNIADRMQYHTSEHQATFSYRNLSVDLRHRWIYEYMFSFLLSRIRRLTRTDTTFRQVEFMYSAPHYATRYEEVFGCPVYFGREFNTITLDQESTRLVLPSRDSHLCHMLRGQADQQLTTLDAGHLVYRVKALISDSMMGIDCNAEETAKKLHMDKATLNRKLKKYDLSFQKILDATRHEFANHLLRLGDDADSIALKLGFSEVSSYKRALKRWEK